MPGFATIVREHQQLAVGFNATINISMQVSTVQETVTVSGQSPVVDQKASKIVTNFDAEKLDITAELARLCGRSSPPSPAVQLQRVDVGGSNAGTQTGYSAYDTKADQHRPMVEGIVMTEGTDAAGFYYDYGSFAEVSVGTGSHGAEMGWPGVAQLVHLEVGRQRVPRPGLLATIRTATCSRPTSTTARRRGCPRRRRTRGDAI